jgi:hypothetical protein
MEDRRVSRPAQELRQDDLAAHCWAGTIVALPPDAFLAVRQGATVQAPKAAASREDIFELLTEHHQAAGSQAQTGAEARRVAASGC